MSDSVRHLGMASTEIVEHGAVVAGMQHPDAAPSSDDYDPEDAGRSDSDGQTLAHPFMPVKLIRRRDTPPIGAELESLSTFRAAARRLKAAELEFRAAQQAYADAVKQLSEEATK